MNQMQPGQPPAKQTIYPIANMSVGEIGPGQRAIVVDTPTDGQIVFPLSTDAAKIVGTALLAPGVVLPDGNNTPPRK